MNVNIHVDAHISDLFIFIASLYSIMKLYYNVYTHSATDRLLGCFQFKATVNKVWNDKKKKAKWAPFRPCPGLPLRNTSQS